MQEPGLSGVERLPESGESPSPTQIQMYDIFEISRESRTRPNLSFNE